MILPVCLSELKLSAARQSVSNIAEGTYQSSIAWQCSLAVHHPSTLFLLHLQIVLQLLREHEMYANLAKCKFVQPKLHFLCHVVGAQGLWVDPQKVAIVQDWPVRKDKTCCRSSGALPIFL